jgi:hypothetical protein
MLIPKTAQHFDIKVYNRTASVLHVRLTHPQGDKQTQKTWGEVLKRR